MNLLEIKINGKSEYLNTDKIIVIREIDVGTVIYMEAGWDYKVLEPIDSVLKRIYT